MADGKNPNEPKQLNEDDLAQVSGGRGNSYNAVWDGYEERKLQADYAAHGAGMTLDEFIMTRGFCALEIECRNKWIRYGAREDTSCVGNERGVDAIRA